MLKTVIFEPSDALSGFLELGMRAQKLTVRYTLKRKGGTEGMCKLYALSSKKPFNEPAVTDTLEFKGEASQGEREIRYCDLARLGYDAADIDTFAVVNLGCLPLKVEAVCFFGLKWDAEGAFAEKNKCNGSKSHCLVEQNISGSKEKLTIADNEKNLCTEKNCEPQIKDPVERARELLESIRENTKTRDPSVQKHWIKTASENVKSLTQSDAPLPVGYKWYVCPDIRPVVPLSAYRHLLFTPSVLAAWEAQGSYLFGLGENGRTALALKTAGVNPFANADDCAVKTGDYWTVGVCLGEDGQYFERICSNGE